MRLFILFLFTILFVAPSPATAARDDCLRAEQSAQVRICLAQIYEDAAGALQDTFVALQKSGDVDTDALQAAQQSWINYRDMQCALETAQIENESLKAIQGLSCLNDLTHSRTAHLEKQATDLGAGVHERLENVPRWMNALAADHPDVFWRYGAVTQGDLDCDGVIDDIVLGLQSDNAASAQVKVAIAQSADTGRPSVSVLSFPLKDAQENAQENAQASGRVCSAAVRMNFVSGITAPPNKPDAAAGSSAQESAHCGARLVLVDEICASHEIGWAEDRFMLINNQAHSDAPQ